MVHVAWFNAVVSKLFLSEGHTSYYTAVQGWKILCNVIVSGYVTFYQIRKCFVNAFFSLLTECLCCQVKWLCGPDLVHGP